ncbi:DNA primase small subunit-like isoform X1 [Vespa mandarinia]|uniref:DNA primase small subunit-like isoform X1 n=2 Tax=Vespa mandarinia TaxID=7446 RepID=UPI0016190544|nr:DNA primase small subunit-like isoform X1 [Vespa mandarinia]XP_035730839.1 DNA primase small subunit-like isoform X1 [Vespa mandarinia]XP_035730840.1 DNA primase small subunit-like isoform X1 [Vespa mandarinia]
MSTCNENIYKYLDIYYQILFPYEELCTWLGYGDVATISFREFSLRLLNQLFIRNKSFPIPSQMKATILKELPIAINIGAIYNTPPRCKSIAKFFVEKELVFDVDISDYDDVRTCCKGSDICTRCWKYIVIACKILNICLRHDFGYDHILWIFSGRRGIHCWVCDKAARILNQNKRNGILNYMQHQTLKCFIKEDHFEIRKLNYYDRRVLAIIEPEFIPLCIVDQNLLGTEEGVDYFLALLPDNEAQTDVKQLFNDRISSIDRWNSFTEYHKNMINSGIHYWKGLEEYPDHVKLHYCGPRFDRNVTEGTTHLLRCPFSVHNETGKVVIPFDLAEVEKFDPSATPTTKQLITEINILRRNRSIEGDVGYASDYHETSLRKPMDIFQRFVKRVIQTK